MGLFNPPTLTADSQALSDLSWRWGQTTFREAGTILDHGWSSTTSGTISAVATGNGTLQGANYATNASANTDAAWNNNLLWNISHRIQAQFAVELVNFANQRTYCGFSSLAFVGGGGLVRSDTPATDGIFFRASTTAGDVNWQACSKDGTTQTTTNTGIAIATSTKYLLGFSVNSTGTAVDYYINEVLVASHSTNLPRTSQSMAAGWAVSTTENVIKNIRFYHVRIKFKTVGL